MHSFTFLLCCACVFFLHILVHVHVCHAGLPGRPASGWWDISCGKLIFIFIYLSKTTWLASELLVSIVPALVCGFCMQNSDFWIRITSLYGCQTSPVDLWMQNNVLRSRMTLVYWCQSSFGALFIQKSDFSIRLTSLYGSQPSFVAFACKKGTLGPELQISMGPRLHLRVLYSKQHLQHQNCKSQWAPAFICGFVHSQQSHYDQN